MEGFKSKYSGAEVEERLDKVDNIPKLEEKQEEIEIDLKALEEKVEEGSIKWNQVY